MKKTKRTLRKEVKIFLGVVGGILFIYLGFCFIAGMSDFTRNTTINGIDVGSMSKQEAVTALSEQFAKDTQDLKMILTIQDKEYPIDLKDNVAFYGEQAVNDIIKEIDSSFFIKGYHYFIGEDFYAPVIIKNEDQLKASIQASGLLNYDTTVPTTYQIGDDSILFTKGKDGKKATVDQTMKQIKDALNHYDFKNEIECQLVENRLEDGEMEALHEKLCQEAKNATLNKKNNQIIDGKVGIDYQLEDAKKAFSRAKSGATFEVKATITQPKISKADLEKNLFRDTLGSYSTYVSGSSVRKNNVRLAGLKCNTILLPGEEFSFNNTVGERTPSRGFGAAAAYKDGETVDEVGGGVCQTSSTLYNAVMLSNLEVTLRYNHSYVSSYVPIGRDATVSWGGPDFRFKNNTDYPIKIVMSYSNSRLYAKIVGTNVNGTTVKITSEQLSSKPFTTKQVDDPTLEVGQTKVKTSGYNGATAQSYRYVYDRNGQLISKKKEAYSNYKKRDKVVLIGTKPVANPPVEPTAPTQPGETISTQPTQ